MQTVTAEVFQYLTDVDSRLGHHEYGQARQTRDGSGAETHDRRFRLFRHRLPHPRDGTHRPRETRLTDAQE